MTRHAIFQIEGNGRNRRVELKGRDLYALRQLVEELITLTRQAMEGEDNHPELLVPF